MDALDLLRAQPFDDELRLVVADQLMHAGDPHGELAIVQHRLRTAPTAALRGREAALIAELLHGHDVGALDEASREQLLGVTWHLGWIRRARLQLAGFREAEVAALFDWLVDARSARLLEHLELRVDVLWTRNILFDDYLAKLIERGPYPALRTLDIGGFVDAGPHGASVDRDLSAVYITNRHLDHEGAVVGAMSRLCPHLETLRLQGNVAQIGRLVLPRGRVVEVCTSSLGKEALAGLAGAHWPELERLVLWFGDGEYGYGDPCDPDEVARFVAELGAKCPRLRHLAIANSPWTEEILELLGAAPPRELLGRLAGLDVSLGTLGPAGARTLVELRRHLPALALLDVTRSYLDHAALAQLRDAYRGCEVRGHAAEVLPAGERYCAVGE